MHARNDPRQRNQQTHLVKFASLMTIPTLDMLQKQLSGLMDEISEKITPDKR